MVEQASRMISLLVSVLVLSIAPSSSGLSMQQGGSNRAAALNGSSLSKPSVLVSSKYEDKSASDAEARAAVLLKAMVDAGVPMDGGVAEALANMSMSPLIGPTDGPLSDPISLWRFYEASDNKPEAAVEYYTKISEWRETYPGGLRKLMHEYTGEDYYGDNGVRSLEGCDARFRTTPTTEEALFAKKFGCFMRLPDSKNGEPVAYMNIKNMTLNEFLSWENRQLLMRAASANEEDIFQCLRAKSLQKKTLLKAYQIIDLADLGLRDSSQLPRIKHFLDILFDTFPPWTYRQVILIHAPGVFPLAWKIIQGFLSQHSRDLVKIYSSGFESLPKDSGIDTLDLSQLPKSIGGSMEEDHRTAMCEGHTVIDKDTAARLLGSSSDFWENKL